MGIQGYILDHWIGKMSAEHPVLMVYDKEGTYYDLLPMLKDRGVRVIDTTKAHLHARLSAQRIWCKDLSLNKDVRMVIYRKRTMPSNNRLWVEEPYAAFMKGGSIFPQGPQDMYENMCRSFLLAKQNELNQLFETGTPGFNLVNALLDGAAYPELEQLTGGKSVTETTIGLLSLNSCADMKWQKEWKAFSEAQFPGLDTSGNSLQEIQSKLWTYLLFSEFVFDLPEALPDNLKSVPIAPTEMKEKVYLICDQLRNRIDLRERYVRAANKVTEQLGLTDAKVIDELDYLKVSLKTAEGKKSAENALRYINRNIDSKDRTIKLKVSDTSLLPEDFNKKSPDNMILSVALKFKGDNPILLTPDNGLQAKAKVLGIATVSLRDILSRTKNRFK